MSVNGKRDDFTMQDLVKVAELSGIKNVGSIIQRTADAVAQWPQFADTAGVPIGLKKNIQKTHRLQILKN